MTGMRKLTIRSLGEELDILKEKVKEIEVLKEQVKEIPVLKQTVKELEKNIENLEKGRTMDIPKKESITDFQKCKKCELTFGTKRDLKKHMKTDHAPSIKCGSCDRIFAKKYELEVHMKDDHSTSEHFKCDCCDKTFVLKWRLLMHKKNHETKWVKKCHYFNNNLVCPFEEMGCMFLHEDSVICKFGEQCSRNLCSYKHRKVGDDEDICDENNEENDESELITSTFQTSTPKKRDNRCEDCENTSECVECIVKRVTGEHGGVSTASCTPAMDCSELGSGPWS